METRHSVLNSAGRRHGRCDSIQSVNEGWDIAVFQRNKVAMDMEKKKKNQNKTQAISVCIRGRNKEVIEDELGFLASHAWENSSNLR